MATREEIGEELYQIGLKVWREEISISEGVHETLFYLHSQGLRLPYGESLIKEE